MGSAAIDRPRRFGTTIAERVHDRVGAIAAGGVGAPDQHTVVAGHEYQHDQWIFEVRAQNLGDALPADPDSDALCRFNGYLLLNPLR